MKRFLLLSLLLFVFFSGSACGGDFNNTTKKIFHPNPPLAIEGVTRGFAPILWLGEKSHF